MTFNRIIVLLLVVFLSINWSYHAESIPANIDIEIDDCVDIQEGYNEQESWTVMVYMIGSDLESGSQAATKDILEMVKVGSRENLNVIICTGGANADHWREVNYYRVIQDNLEPLGNLGTQDMANPELLTNFVTYSLSNFAADHYALFLWNHGAGINGFGHDEVSGKGFTLNQLSSTLWGIHEQTQIKYDLLGFDACLMASLEVAVQVSGLADFMVASEETEPGHGWNYTPVLQSIVSSNITNGAELGRIIADGFYNQAKTYGTSGVTLSVIDLESVYDVLFALEDMVTAPAIQQAQDLLPLAKSRVRSEAYGRSSRNPAFSMDGIDLEDFARHLIAEQPAVANEAWEIIQALQKAVVYNIHDESKPNASGLSIFFPYEKLTNTVALDSAMSLYKRLQVSQPYDHLINRFIGRAGIDDQGPQITEGNLYEEEDYIAAVTNDPDVDEIYMVLIDATGAEDGTIEFLGVMLPDYQEFKDNGGVEFSHEWDGAWIGINDYPVYISDIFTEVYIDELTGEEKELVVMLIPALLNGQEVILTYSVDIDDGTYELEGINPEVEEEGMYKRGHLEIEAGDQLSLVYEAYDLDTEESYWYEGQVFELYSEEDLELTISDLQPGAYMLGILMTDYSRNVNFELGDNIYVVE